MNSSTLSADTLLSVQDLSRMLQVPVPTLYKWRTTGGGPRAARVGKHIRYRLSDVHSWLDDQSSEPRE